MKSHTARVFVSLCVSAVFAIPIQLSAQGKLANAGCVDELPIATFDAPGAGTGPGTTNCFSTCPGTVAEDSNAAGVVTGYFVDGSGVYHGFLRVPYGEPMHFPEGQITVFDAPGAGTGPNQGTVAYGINSQGAIAGQFQDEENVYHGFLRSPSGQFTVFDIPGSNAGANQGPFGSDNINDKGEIAGYYGDGNNLIHGFVRLSDGTIQTFDAPGAAPIPGLGTFVSAETGLNLGGAVTGTYYDANNIAHGFVRTAEGTITEFDAPGAGTGTFQGTFVASINNLGEIAGGVFDDNNVTHGFLRLTDGFIETGEVPGSGTGSGQGTFAVSINAQSIITAYYTDFNNVTHGSVRYPDGRIRTFNVIAAGNGVGQGTTPQTIDPAGRISGYYTDQNNVNHGFLFTPQNKCEK